MINLLYKDFKLMFGTNKNISSRIIQGLIRLIFIAIFITIEVFLFTSILKRISSFSNAAYAYMNLFLFIISILLIISGVFQANKLFFNEQDIEQLSVHPVSNSSIIFSKLVFLFIIHYATCFMFVYPLFVSYAILIGKGVWFYYIGLFYPLLSFILEIGVALIFVYPLYLVKKFLKKHLVVKFIVSIVILLVISVLYSIVLNLFINFIAGGNTNQLVSTAFISKIQGIERFEIPLKFLVNAFINRNFKLLLPFILISIGIFTIGVSICIFTFNYVRNVSINKDFKKEFKEIKPVKPVKALIKKEVMLLFKNSDYATSFSSLLIIQPFLAYLVVSSLNTIFSNGVFAYYLTVVPNFLNIIDIIIIMFFTVMIAQGASLYISMEKKTIKVMKVMPIAFGKQIFIKVSIPFILSVASLIVTLLTLLIGKVINGGLLLITLVMSVLILLAYIITSLNEELSIKHKKPRSTFVSGIVAYVIPIVIASVSLFLSFKGVSINICYLLGIGILLLFIIPYTIYVGLNLNSKFLDLDMVN